MDKLKPGGLNVDLRWTPHPVIVAIRNSKDCIRILLYSYYTTIILGSSYIPTIPLLQGGGSS